MSTVWNTKYGTRRVRFDPPTLKEAIAAARGLTDDLQQQAEIAAALMELPVEEVRAELLKLAPPRNSTQIVTSNGREGAARTVIVERKQSRRPAAGTGGVRVTLAGKGPSRLNRAGRYSKQPSFVRPRSAGPETHSRDRRRRRRLALSGSAVHVRVGAEIGRENWLRAGDQLRQRRCGQAAGSPRSAVFAGFGRRQAGSVCGLCKRRRFACGLVRGSGRRFNRCSGRFLACGLERRLGGGGEFNRPRRRQRYLRRRTSGRERIWRPSGTVRSPHGRVWRLPSPRRRRPTAFCP